MQLLDRSIYKKTFGPIGIPWGDSAIKQYEGNKELLYGAVLYMPTKIQISQPGEAEELWQLPNEPLISISGGKSIIRTAIDGNKGTFKEGFSIDDYSIVIRGICINEDVTSEEKPEDQIRKIRTACETLSSLRIVNDMLSMFGISQVVIESFEFPDAPGAPSIQPYILYCVSDQEFELELKPEDLQ